MAKGDILCVNFWMLLLWQGFWFFYCGLELMKEGNDFLCEFPFLNSWCIAYSSQGGHSSGQGRARNVVTGHWPGNGAEPR